ncbi:C6 transcription factor [Apiospora phragmitis]|uniref:C6 transcription factor n=1 Tax=Apiospora phragmitis TaxID=2905665 RepID=A0ABR1VZE7_9PEZI
MIPHSRHGTLSIDLVSSVMINGRSAPIAGRPAPNVTRPPLPRMNHQQRMCQPLTVPNYIAIMISWVKPSYTKIPPPSYTRELEERVAFLESRVTKLNGLPFQQQEEEEKQGQQQHHPSQSHFSSRNSNNNNSSSNALGEVVELLSMGNFEAPAYIGSSSGLNLALNLGEMVQATVWNKAIPSRGGENNFSSPSSHKRRKSSAAGTSFSCGGSGGDIKCSSPATQGSPTKAITMDEVIANSAGPPGDELGLSILSAYFSQIHPRYPFLDPAEVWVLHHERAALAATPIPNLTKQQRFGIFKLYMVYAIGAMLLQLTEKHTSSPPESYYMSALQHIFAARESRTTQNIEAMALLVLYHLRSPSSFGIWYMIGLAMRTSIDLGLHMRRNEDKLTEGEEVQMRRRLFWSVYALERTIAISMGRPFSIPDRQIDVELPEGGNGDGASGEGEGTPFLGADGIIGNDHRPLSSGGGCMSPKAAGSSGGVGSYPTSWKTSLTPAIFLFKLRRIESRIQHSIYRTDKPLAALVPKLDRYYGELEAWKQELLQSPLATTAPGTTNAGGNSNSSNSNSNGNGTNNSNNNNNNELNYPLLHYHRAVRLLVQPFLALLPPTDPYYARCLASAGDICQAHKRLHQTLDYGHSFIAVQTVFVAGITLLYGLWTHPARVWSVRLADDVRACSLVLFVMGERAPWVRKYRDAFELLVSAAMEKLQQQGGVGERGGGADDGILRAAEGQKSAAASDAADVTIDPQIIAATTTTLDQEQQQQQQQQQQQHSILSQMNPGGDDHEAWRVVAELASWIDQDKEHPPVWMPDFETLQSLS